MECRFRALRAILATGRDTRHLVSSFDSHGFTFSRWSEHAGAEPVAGVAADAGDDGVDFVAIAFGVRESFQNDHAQSFAEYSSVCIVVEAAELSVV